MPLAKNKLSVRALTEIASPGVYGDGDGLYLRVNRARDGSAGSRQWVHVYHLRGKRKEMGLGGYPSVGLTAARAKRDGARAELAAGRSPIRRGAGYEGRPGGHAFGRVAMALIADIEGGFRNLKHARQWRTTLQRYTKPIWDMPVAAVDTEAVLECLRPIWTTIPETADRVRGRIERVLDVARVKGLRTGENPARWRGHLALIMPNKGRRTQRHHAAMPYAEVPDFIATMRLRETTGARLLELTVLTAARSGEAVGARCQEVDLDAELWIVPGARMKAGQDHRVPLVGRALEIMREACEGRPPHAYVFPGQKPGRPASNMSMAMLLRRLGSPYTVHGFRSSFRDWAGDQTDFPEEIVEQALAHTVGSNVRRAYRRGDALEKRRELMKVWDTYCASSVLKLAVEMAFGRKARSSG